MNYILFFESLRKTQPKTIIFQVHVSLSGLFVIMSMMSVLITMNFVLAIDLIGQERYNNIILI